MAKEKKAADTTAETTTKRKSPTQEAAAAFKFTVTDLAEKLGIEPASARVQLRNKGIAKNGTVYGWNTQKELDEVVKTLRAGNDDKPAKADNDDKPAKADKAPAKSDKKTKKAA